MAKGKKKSAAMNRGSSAALLVGAFLYGTRHALRAYGSPNRVAQALFLELEVGNYDVLLRFSDVDSQNRGGRAACGPTTAQARWQSLFDRCLGPCCCPCWRMVDNLRTARRARRSSTLSTWRPPAAFVNGADADRSPINCCAHWCCAHWHASCSRARHETAHPDGQRIVNGLSSRHAFSVDAVTHMLFAVLNGNGGMAQFTRAGSP